jgi:hypothetical protein
VSFKDLKPGWNPNPHFETEGTIVVVAWHAAQYAPRDPDLCRRPKLLRARDIWVARDVSESYVAKPRVYWSDGVEISDRNRKGLSKRIQARIEQAIRDSRRVAGAGR